jgi:ABC-type Fe3+ transport system substrate-binding protein
MAEKPNGNRRRLRGAFVAMLALAPALQPAAAAELSAEMKDVVAKANQEGVLKVIWPGNLLGGTRGLATIEQDMNKMFGTTIKISHSPTGSIIQLGFQLATEAKANVPASTDVYIGVVNVLPMLDSAKTLLPVAWPKLLPGRVDESMVELNGGAVRLASLVIGVTYNTKLVTKPPKRLNDILAPEFKGKIATNPQGVGFDQLLASDQLGHDKGLAFLGEFSQQIGGLINCTDQTRIATGEFAAMMFDCGPIDAIKMKESGLPVEQVLLRDFMPVGYYYGTIPTNAQHQNAAKILIAYLLTEEGQKLQWELWREDLHLLPGSRMAGLIADAVKDGAKPFEVDAKWYMAHPEIDAGRPDILKIIRQGK